MATGMREKTTNVGGVIKRIWYAMTGTTQGAELASLDDTGKFKCVSEQVSGLAGTGNRMVVADATGNLSAPLNKFTTTYYEGIMASVPANTWTVLMECPTGKTTLALTIGSNFATDTIYYSQAEFARVLSGTPVTIYAVTRAEFIRTQARLNGNNIEVLQTSGGANQITYRYIVENSRV